MSGYQSRRLNPRNWSGNQKKLVYSLGTVIFLGITVILGLMVFLSVYYLIAGNLDFLSDIGLSTVITAELISIEGLITMLVFLFICYFLYRYFNNKRKGY